MSETKEPFLLVVNPRAGAGRAEKNLPRLQQALSEAGAKYDVARTSRTAHATELVRDALRRGMRGIAVVGGDGTLNEALNGFFDEDGAVVDRDAWLGPLSIGTGGDFRKTLGSPSVGIGGNGIEALVTRMLWSKPRRIDVGWLELVGNDGVTTARAFLNIASFGVGGLVDRLVNDTPKWIGGTPAFLLGTMRGLRRYSPQRVRITVGDKLPRETRIVNVAVANGRYFGGGMMIAPRAELDDGAFDVVGIETTVRESLRLTAKIYAGSHVGSPGVTSQRATVVHAEPVDPSDHVLLDVDGEAPGRLPATFTIRPGAIQIRG